MNENRLKNYEEQIHKIFKGVNEGSYSSRYTYEQSCNEFAKWLSNSEFKLSNIKNISFKHINAYVEDCKEKNLSSATIIKNLSAIRYMADKGEFKNRLPQDNKQWNLEKRNSGQIDRSWSKSEFNGLIETAAENKRNDVIISAELSKNFGLRIEETLHITPKILENTIKHGEMYVTKTKHGRPRAIVLTNSEQYKIAKDLLNYCKIKGIKDNQRILQSEKGILKEKRSIEKFIYNHRDKFVDRQYRASTNGKIKEQMPTFHGLRYTYVQELEKNGYKKYITQNTGHNRKSTDKIYSNK